MQDTAASSYADGDLRKLLPVRTMTRTRRCGPLLSDEHNGAELGLLALPTMVNQRHTARRRPRSAQLIAGAMGGQRTR
jgi:hypothetical protein